MSNIQKLLIKGFTWTEICKELKCCKSTVAYHAKKLKMLHANLLPIRSQKRIEDFNWKEIQEYAEHHTKNDILKHFNLTCGVWRGAVKKGLIKSKELKKELFEVATANSKYSRNHLKERIIKNDLIPYVCAICAGIPTWNNKPLVLIIDHINGINNDHRLENLRFVCPNSNSQLPTFAGRNTKRKTGR